MITKKKTLIEIEELDDYFRLIEAQRDLVYHLQKYKENLEQRKKELENIEQLALRLKQLKCKFRGLKLNNLPEEDIKKINNLLQARHISL